MPLTNRASRSAAPTSRSIVLNSIGRRRVDLFSPPMLLLANYILIYGLGWIDVVFEDLNPTSMTFRARWFIQYYDGISAPAIIYLVLGFIAFVVGYASPLGSVVAEKLPRGRPVAEGSKARSQVVYAVAFVATFSILWMYVQSIGYGRYTPDGTTRPWLESLSLLGETSLLPYAALAGIGVQAASGIKTKWSRYFFWLIALPAQVSLSIFIETRTRLVTVLLVLIFATHYRRRWLTLWPEGILVGAAVVVCVATTGWIRTPVDDRPSAGLGYLWETILGRSSGFETYTATFDHRDNAPTPDSVVMLAAASIVPRFLWPNKPNAVAGEEFSYWLGGRGAKGLSPTLPGELLLQFGLAGGVLTMFFLGAGWKILRVWLSDTAAEWLYWALLPSLLTVEAGFSGAYSVLLRFLLAGLVIAALSGSFTRRKPIGRSVAPSPLRASVLTARRHLSQ